MLRSTSSLRVGLAGVTLLDAGVGAGSKVLAEPIAHAQHGREVLIDGVLRRDFHIVRVHVDDGGVASDGAGPLDIEIGFRKITLQECRIGVGNLQQLRIVRGQAEVAAELLDIRNLDLRLPDNGNLLISAIDAGVVKGLDVVDNEKSSGAMKWLPLVEL